MLPNVCRTPYCRDAVIHTAMIILPLLFNGCSTSSTPLAERYNAPTPRTNEIVARDRDVGICLYRWNLSFARPITSGDPDAFDGMIGGDSVSELVACFQTWMTQRQAWHLRAFFRSSIRDDNIVVEIRVER